jgi:type II secretory pathway pseudopilin PulG
MNKNVCEAQRSRGEEGFTLIEALIAILILVFGLMAIANLYAIAGTSNTVANAGTVAAAVASEKMEELKSYTFDDAKLVAGGNLDSDTKSEEVTIPGAGIIKTRWEIVDVSNDPPVKFIAVRSQAMGAVTGARSRAEFTTFRACTVATQC